MASDRFVGNVHVSRRQFLVVAAGLSAGLVGGRPALAAVLSMPALPGPRDHVPRVAMWDFYPANPDYPYRLRSPHVGSGEEYGSGLWWGVRGYQVLLNENGFPIEVDGIYGPKTAAKVAAFQRATGLLADGRIGPATAQALMLRTVLDAAAEFGMSPRILMAHQHRESNSDLGAVGPVGEHGLAQINRKTHKEVTYQQSWDPVFQIRYMAKRDAESIRRLGLEPGLFSYNNPPAARQWARTGVAPAKGREYVDNILGVPLDFEAAALR